MPPERKNATDLFALFFDKAPFAAFIKDAQSRHLYVNKFVEEIIGQSRDQIADKRLDEIFDAETAKMLREADLRVIESGETDVKEGWLDCLSGNRRYIVDTKFPIDLPGHEEAALVGFGLDITEQREAETALAQAQKMEALGQLVAGIAHDFNNSLAILQGNLDVLKRHRSKVDIDETIDEMLSAVSRGTQLTKQLLAFGRKAALHPRSVDLEGRFADSTLKLLRSALPENIEIEFAAEQDLPPVLIDVNGIDNVLLNLAFNARDAMPEGGVFRIALKTPDRRKLSELARDSGEDFVLLEVEDNGHGMSPEVRNRLFEPFFTTKNIAQGTGMGMSMVHGLLAQIGGEILVASEEGAGTTISIFLPVGDALDVAEESTPEAEEPVAGMGNILLVEDEPQLRATLERMIRMMGYAVTAVEDGPAALDLLQSADDPFNLLVADIVLPRQLTGYQLAELALASHPDMQVVLLSGYPIVNAEVETGGFEVLPKPLSFNVLQDAIRLRIGADGEGNGAEAGEARLTLPDFVNRFIGAR